MHKFHVVVIVQGREVERLENVAWSTLQGKIRNLTYKYPEFDKIEVLPVRKPK